MKIVIDIPEDEYTWLKEHPNSIRWSSVYTDSILNGTPLNEVLDQIRTEIKQLPKYGAKFLNGYFTVHIDVDEALQIIDKYRGEVDCRECKAEYECYYCKKYAENEDKE